MQETNSCVLARKSTALSPTAFLIPCSTEMPRIPLYHGKLNHQKLRTWVHLIYEPTGQTITNRILIRNGNASKKLVKLRGLRCECCQPTTTTWCEVHLAPILEKTAENSRPKLHTHNHLYCNLCLYWNRLNNFYIIDKAKSADHTWNLRTCVHPI